MGSPPMNFLRGSIENNRFESHGVSLPVTTGNGAMAREAVMGFRAEDADIVKPGSGLFDATVYAAEPTGEMTLVTLVVGKESLSVKMPKDYDIDFDSTVAVNFPLERGFLFDARSGEPLALRFASAS